MGKIKVTLVRSTIGSQKAQKATVEALKLNKIGASNVFEDNPCVRGMINKVQHLLKVEKVK